MRRAYCTLTPATVRDLAATALARALHWHPHRSVTAGALRDLVLAVAALGSSLWAVVRRFRFPSPTRPPARPSTPTSPPPTSWPTG